MNGRTFRELSTALKALNTVVLLSGSNAELFREARDKPSGDHLAELRRVNNEFLDLSKVAIQATGRAMALLTVQGRARWLDKCDVKNPNRKIVLDQPISETGLLGTGTSYLKAEWKKTQEDDEALRACLPRRYAPPPPPPPPPRGFGGYRPATFPPAAQGGSRRPFSQPPRQQRPDRRDSRDPSRDRQAPSRRGASPSPVRGGQRGGRRPFNNKRPRQ